MNPLLVLRARAEARALLYAAGDCDLGEAVAPLEQYAETSGLAERWGHDACATIILEPFKPYLRD